jgi:hypothetical protein
MPLFVKGGTTGVPFGRNEFLRSTHPEPRTESHTCAASTVTQTTDANGNRVKILQPGTVMAKITSGADIGKVGPFQALATDGRQTLANIVGLAVTFLPWQLLEGDREIAVAYDECVAVQPWCIEYDNTGASIPLTNATAAAMLGLKKLNINFS